MKLVSCKHLQKIKRHLKKLYGTKTLDHLFERFYMTVGRYGIGMPPIPKPHKWTEKDTLLITYANSITSDEEAPLVTLNRFCNKHLQGLIKTVHILPFFPWSSDDGFSIIDYRQVDKEYGTWQDIEALSKNFSLMVDLVLNHCSAQSNWFRDYLIGIDPARRYFIELDPNTDVSSVTRPRTSPLLTKATTRYGETHVWTTFSEDQVDLNWKNPDVLFEFIDILFQYIHHGARIIRLDAVAYAWKELGTSCIHLEEVHELVKLLRAILETVAPNVWLITETNVPHEENIAYFGNGDEAQIVYNFTLAPLILHTLLNGNAEKLTTWAAGLKPPPRGCTFLNFTASHDGIGVRPLEGLVSDKELKALIKHVEKRGGAVSYKANSDGSKSPYELNTTYFSALDIPEDSDLGIQRFLCSQAIALAFRGIPASYIHSLLGTANDIEAAKETGIPRRINRHIWDKKNLELRLKNESSTQSKIFKAYKQLLQKRTHEPAFHPEAEQIIHTSSPGLFIVERIALGQKRHVLCTFNCTAKSQSLPASLLGDIFKKQTTLHDIITGKRQKANGKGLTLKPYQALWLIPDRA